MTQKQKAHETFPLHGLFVFRIERKDNEVYAVSETEGVLKSNKTVKSIVTSNEIFIINIELLC